MIFNSRKLRKALVSGLIAAGMGVAPAHGAGVFESFGQLASSVVDFSLSTFKTTAGVAGFAKVGSTLAAKNDMVDVGKVNSYRKEAGSYLSTATEGYIDSQKLDKVFDYTLVQAECVEEKDGTKVWKYGDNVTPVLHEVAAFVGATALQKVKKGADQSSYNAGQEAGQKKRI